MINGQFERLDRTLPVRAALDALVARHPRLAEQGRQHNEAIRLRQFGKSYGVLQRLAVDAVDSDQERRGSRNVTWDVGKIVELAPAGAVGLDSRRADDRIRSAQSDTLNAAQHASCLAG